MLRDILYLVIGLIVGAIIGFMLARNYMKKYLGVDDDKTESLYQQINMITELAIYLNMRELLK